jgi:8-oxo-dGTP pyrophosphatase MutT (NUDIX family)
MDESGRDAAHRAASDAELIAWVDEQDNLLGSLVRSDLRERGLIGRRTLSKAIYPGYWDVAAGGMVQAHESYAESAARELAEELGVSGVELVAHDHFYFEDTGSRLWCSAFSAVWDGPLVLQPEEVLEARFLPVEQVLDEIRHKPYCPDSLAALGRYLRARECGVAKKL